MTGSSDRPPVARGPIPGPAVPARLCVELCGRFGVQVDGAPVGDEALRRSKTRAVLAMLALAPHFQLRRERLADSLWPDLDGDGAANQLAKAVHALRRALEPDLAPRAASRFLVSRDGILQLMAPGGVSVDAIEFRDAARFGLAAGTAAALGSAVGMLPDELLPEFLYESWTIHAREELRMLRARVLERAAELSEVSAETSRAERLWQRLLDVEPASEVAYRGLIRAAVRRGDHTLALRWLAACRESMRRELDVEPDASTVAMASAEVPEVGPRASFDTPNRLGPVVVVDVRHTGRSAPEIMLTDSSRPLAAPKTGRLRAFGRVAAVFVIVALTGLFVAVTPPGRSVQRGMRKSVRAIAALVTGQPADPAMVVLAGSGVAAHARVDVVGSRSGLATYADAEGRFSLPGVAWRPGQSYEVAVSSDGRMASVVRLLSTGRPSDQGVLELGVLPPSSVQPIVLERVAGLNSFAAVDFHDDAYLSGVVRAVTVGLATDADRVRAIDAFVASLYVPTAIDRRSPRETIALGSGRASDINDAMAALARVAGYGARLVDVCDPHYSELTYPLVEISFEGAWHVYDPAMATRFARDDGRVPSFAEVWRRPDFVHLAGVGSRTYWDEVRLRRVYASPLHRYRVVESEAPIVG